MTASQEQVTWQELGGVIVALELVPGYSITTGRAFVEVDGTLLWAEVGQVTLSPEVPGAGALQGARLAAHAKAAEREREDWLASLTPEQREREEEAHRKFLAMPDPPDWQVEAYLERHGR